MHVGFIDKQFKKFALFFNRILVSLLFDCTFHEFFFIIFSTNSLSFQLGTSYALHFPKVPYLIFIVLF